MKIFSTTEARKQFALLVENVKMRSEAVAIGRRNLPEVLVIPYPKCLNPEVNEITNVNANSNSFDFLGNEPDLYSVTDLKKRYA